MSENENNCRFNMTLKNIFPQSPLCKLLYIHTCEDNEQYNKQTLDIYID